MYNNNKQPKKIHYIDSPTELLHEKQIAKIRIFLGCFEPVSLPQPNNLTKPQQFIYLIIKIPEEPTKNNSTTTQTNANPQQKKSPYVGFFPTKNSTRNTTKKGSDNKTAPQCNPFKIDGSKCSMRWKQITNCTLIYLNRL